MRPHEIRAQFPKVKSETVLCSYAEEDLIHRVALRVLLFRRALGMTQAELGAAVAKDQPFISEVEAGFRNLTLRSMAQLAYALDRDPEDFLRLDLDLDEVAAASRDKATASG